MSESLAEDGSNSCSFAGDFGAAYHALLAQDMEIKLVPVHANPATQAKSGPTPTRAPLSVVSGAEVDGRKAGGADGMAATGWRHDGHVAMRRPDGITTESLDSEFEEALVRCAITKGMALGYPAQSTEVQKFLEVMCRHTAKLAKAAK